MTSKEYKILSDHYERCFERYGDSSKGVDWPNGRDAEIRYGVMSELIKSRSPGVTLLDVGCGAGHFYEFLKQSSRFDIEYAGLDISPKFIEFCQQKYPDLNFYQCDLLAEPFQKEFDYVIMNGVFTERLTLSIPQMIEFWQKLLSKAFALCRKGLAFNVMSKQVDWERDDLFHLSMDEAAHFINQNLTKSFLTRRDYGLYEYTVYLYREPNT